MIKIKELFLISSLLILVGIVVMGLKVSPVFSKKNVVTVNDIVVRKPMSVWMFHYINKYAEKYGVPNNIAFGIAYHETNYKGICDWNYNPSLTSSAYAYGAMQIQVPTANHFSDTTITKEDLLYNVELNIELSMKIISYLKNKYGTWELALGAYNSGKPIVNSYALSIPKYDIERIF
jgi:soluble lytic murein transglycosylase-like protein